MSSTFISFLLGWINRNTIRPTRSRGRRGYEITQTIKGGLQLGATESES
jgi:hypothetical protein